MNISEYIESGILEQYVLGELNEHERAEVERLAAQHPEIQAELSEINEALGVYAQAHTQTPPAGMRERVLAGWQTAIRSEAPTENAPATEPVIRQMPLASADEERTTGFNWMMAASVSLLLLSGAGNLVFYNRWQQAESNLLAVQNERAQVASAVQAVEKRLSARNQELAVLRSEEFRTVTLAGTKAAPTAKARVLYNPATRAVYVDVRQLPPPPAGKQYQLWALDQGKPVDAGVLAATTATGDSLQQMKDIASAQAFAMTVEPAGGSENPTLSTMTVIGNL